MRVQRTFSQHMSRKKLGLKSNGENVDSSGMRGEPTNIESVDAIRSKLSSPDLHITPTQHKQKRLLPVSGQSVQGQ